MELKDELHKLKLENEQKTKLEAQLQTTKLEDGHQTTNLDDKNETTKLKNRHPTTKLEGEHQTTELNDQHQTTKLGNGLQTMNLDDKNRTTKLENRYPTTKLEDEHQTSKLNDQHHTTISENGQQTKELEDQKQTTENGQQTTESEDQQQTTENGQQTTKLEDVQQPSKIEVGELTTKLDNQQQTKKDRQQTPESKDEQQTIHLNKEADRKRTSKQGMSLVNDEYTITFHYLLNVDSARDLFVTHAPKTIKITNEERIEQESNNSYGNYTKAYKATIILEEAMELRQWESFLYSLWLSKRPENETFSWLEIRKSNMRVYSTEMISQKEDVNVRFWGGSMMSPVKFVKHWELEGDNLCVKFRSEVLSIMESVVEQDVWYNAVDIPFSSMYETIVVCPENRSTKLFINVKSNPKLFERMETGDVDVETRLLCFSRVTREDFGRSSSFCIEWPSDVLDNTNNGSQTPKCWHVISKLKYFGFSVAYANVTVLPYSGSVVNISFDDFNKEYAWACLCSQGYKVTDHLFEENTSVVRSSLEKLTPEMLNSITNTAQNRPFINLVNLINTELKRTIHVFYSEEQEELPPGYSLIRRMVLTPTRHIFYPKEPIAQNRIIRQYDEEYLIRIVFRDEDFNKVNTHNPKSLSTVINDMKQFLRDGFQICDRHYEFLGCSNSQLRQHSFWFFCPSNGIKAQTIRDQCGDISSVTCVASYLSRFGLCFSASRDTFDVGLKPGEVEIQEDIERFGYCFSDGIGKISRSLALKVTSALRWNVTPSAFQIRFGGCKGIVSQDPDIDNNKDVLVIRKSMQKFSSNSKNLEIMQVTSPGRLYLNRQVITLLSGLGVPDNVFLSLQEKMLMCLADMMIYDKDAMKAISELSLNIRLKELQGKGIVLVREPFFRSILITIYKCKIRDLMRYARIQLPFEKGRIMMGTLDETGTLEYGQVFVQYSKSPEQQQTDCVVHIGAVLATKNPCFHPGDLRKFQSIDVPALHHMIDCIVFPQKGKRPHPNEMSGSDLDGDMYFVSWDDIFCETITNQNPMEFPKADKLRLNRKVEVGDIIDYIGEYIKSDNVGIVANLHVVHADMESIFSHACVELAKLHSVAVDFPKTGKPAKIPTKLQVKKYPDFMAKRDKDEYISNKVLGKLFRQCRALERVQTTQKGQTKIVRSVVPDKELFLMGWEMYEEDALAERNVYNNKVRQLLTLYGIENETEAITGIIRTLDLKRGCLKNEKFEIGQFVKAKMSLVWKRTRERFFKEFGGESMINFECCRIDVLLKASAWYIVTYREDPENSEPLLSFPWVISDVIALVKTNTKGKKVEPFSTEVTEKCNDDNLLEIGSSILRHFFSTKKPRRETMQILDQVKETVLSYLRYTDKTAVIPMGTPLVGFMKIGENTFDFFVNTPEGNMRCVLHSIQSHLYERGPRPVYRIKRNNRNYDIRFSKDVNTFRRSLFLTKFIAENIEIAPAVLFLLDWGRQRYIVSGFGAIFDEITFSMIILGSILNMGKLHVKVSYPESVSVNDTCQDTLARMDIGDISKTKQKTLAQVSLYFFREYRTLIINNLSEGMIKFLPDPSHKSQKNLFKTPISQSKTTNFLNAMFLAYQDIAVNGMIDTFFRDYDNVEDRLELRLPLDTWESILFAEAYIERQLIKKTGAVVRIRRRRFRESKGIILEAWGSHEQLLRVEQSLQDLGDKSHAFVSTTARDKAYIEGAYVIMFEGSRSLDDMLTFQQYSGSIQEHHKHRGQVHLPCLQGAFRQINPSLEHINDNEEDCQIFQRTFMEQIKVVRENYDPTYHGILRIALTFGIVYVVDVDCPAMSIRDLQEKLQGKLFQALKKFHSINEKTYARGRRGIKRGGSSINIIRDSLYRGAKRRFCSSFLPLDCNFEKVVIFCEESGFKKDGKENKYYVSLKTGEADFGKPHTGQCVLDKDMNFIEFRLSDFKWLAGDIIRLKTNKNTNVLDVRCKLQSRRILDIESIRQMSDLKGILDTQCRLMRKQGENLHISSDFKDRITFVREKQVDSYSYPHDEDEANIWSSMKINVANVTEYSGYNSIIGTFTGKISRTEVTLIPKLPDIHSKDDEIQNFARKIWNLALFLGSQFE